MYTDAGLNWVAISNTSILIKKVFHVFLNGILLVKTLLSVIFIIVGIQMTYTMAGSTKKKPAAKEKCHLLSLQHFYEPKNISEIEQHGTQENVYFNKYLRST